MKAWNIVATSRWVWKVTMCVHAEMERYGLMQNDLTGEKVHLWILISVLICAMQTPQVKNKSVLYGVNRKTYGKMQCKP